MKARFCKALLKAAGFAIFGWGIVGSLSVFPEGLGFLPGFIGGSGAALIGISELCEEGVKE